MPMEFQSAVPLQTRLPPLVMISVPPGPPRPMRMTLANAALVTVQGSASVTLNSTVVTLLGPTPPVQLLLTFHKPLVSGKASAGFQVTCSEQVSVLTIATPRAC